MLHSIIQWILNNLIGSVALLFGLIYIFLSIKENIWCWISGLISSVLFIYIFYKAKIYADMGLQVYYIFVSLYGWYHWLYGSKSKKKDDLRITNINLRLGIILFLVNAVFFGIIAFILVNYTDSEIPYWDAFTTAGSIIATWMLARKIIEHWLIWIVVDAVSVWLYIYKEVYSALVLLSVYTLLAIIGYFQWKKELRKV